MSEAIQDLMDQLASLEKSTLDIGDNYRKLCTCIRFLVYLLLTIKKVIFF